MAKRRVRTLTKIIRKHKIIDKVHCSSEGDDEETFIYLSDFYLRVVYQ